jgi:hypothetical protein
MTACLEPVPYETLVALWAGELDSGAGERVEQHLFACDVCAASSDRLGQLVVGLRQIVPPVISHAHRDRLLARGMRIGQTPVAAGIDADAYFTADLDLLVHVLKVDLADADRVDVEILDPAGVAQLQLAHVPFDAAAGEVLIACQRHYQYDSAFPGDPVFQVLVHRGGVQRQAERYFVRHHWG